MKNWLRYLLIGMLLLAVGAGLGYRYADQLPWARSNPLAGRSSIAESLSRLLPVAEQQVSFELFWKIWELAQERHIDGPIASEPLVYGAINGLFKFGYKDGYSFFLPPQMSRYLGEQQALPVGTTGMTFDIIGAQVVVADVLAGGAAATAGILPGDVLIKLGEDPARNMTLFELEKALAGEVGAVLPVEFSRIASDGTDQLETRTLRLQPEPAETMTWTALEGGVYHIELRRFTKQTALQWANLAELLAAQNPAGLILDLRSNTGGDIEGVAPVIDDFLTRGLLYRRQDNGDEEEKIQATPAATFPDVPLVVLTNRGTASSAEIVAASLKDNERATVMGATTFGKAAIIRIETLPVPGEILPAVLGLVQGYWLPPRSDSVADVGVTPDIEVDITASSYAEAKDGLLEKAMTELKRLQAIESSGGGQS